MMRILFNNDGSINTLVVAESIQQGNNGVNQIFAEILGRASTDYVCVGQFELPNGDLVELSGERDTITIGDSDYEGFIITLTEAVTFLAGNLKLNLKLVDLQGNVLCTYQVTLKINPTGYEPDATTITESQYNALIQSLNSYLLKTEFNNDYYLKSEVNALLEGKVGFRTLQGTETLIDLLGTEDDVFLFGKYSNIGWLLIGVQGIYSDHVRFKAINLSRNQFYHSEDIVGTSTIADVISNTYLKQVSTLRLFNHSITFTYDGDSYSIKLVSNSVTAITNLSSIPTTSAAGLINYKSFGINTNYHGLVRYTFSGGVPVVFLYIDSVNLDVRQVSIPFSDATAITCTDTVTEI